MSFPATIKPVDIQDTPFTWPVIKTDFETGYRQVRPIIDMQLRSYTLRYEALTTAQLNELCTFWKAMKGQALTFPFTHPVTGEVVNCRFATNTWEPERVSIVGKGWHNLTLALEEARS
jgi:hypothetical protein